MKRWEDEAMQDTDDLLILLNGPLLAPVWVQEDEYSYSLNINLVGHGIGLIIWKGVNAHHPPSLILSRGNNEKEFTWLSSNDGHPVSLDGFRQWVAKALGAKPDAPA
jgi:hypothetical protein